MADPVTWYDRNAVSVADRYESIPSGSVHCWLLDLLPDRDAAVLDVGAGTGRDAAWLAARGHDVVAIEPSEAMRNEAMSRHGDKTITWIDDRMPELAGITRTGMSFDLVLLSAVWMHLPDRSRARAFRKILNLLKPGGVLAITLRCGPVDEERGIHAVSAHEIERLSRNHGAFVIRQVDTKDQLGRKEITWRQMAISLPDDGTGSLPLLRHVILNDDKSSTYKLALLRTLCRIADGAAGMAFEHDDDTVAIPLGLVAMTWIRLYMPLLKQKLPQSPQNVGFNRLAFAKKDFINLAQGSHNDLRIGMTCTGDIAMTLKRAIGVAARNIRSMPANYITYPDGAQVFPANFVPSRQRSASIELDQAFLLSFGSMRVPRHIWNSLQRYGAWIEPTIIAEWKKLIRSYAEGQGRHVNEIGLDVAMVWDDRSRDVTMARDRALKLISTNALHCVWSGRRLTATNLDIDHCFPWSVWPCADLWNLMPTHRTVNQNEKRAKLPGGVLLQTAQERMIDWWESAYIRHPESCSGRFRLEARSSLPAISDHWNGLAEVFEAVCLQRKRLKHYQQVPEWLGTKYVGH